MAGDYATSPLHASGCSMTAVLNLSMLHRYHQGGEHETRVFLGRFVNRLLFHGL